MHYYSSVKALHIIFVVAWFAVLFYFPRLLIYHREASDKEAKEILQDQLLIMMRRLWWGIGVPASLLTLILGLTLFVNQTYISEWLWVKIIFVALLYAYHFYLQYILLRLMHGKKHTMTSLQYRWFNEIPTLLLFAIAFLAVTKRASSWVFPFVFILILMMVFFVMQYLWKRKKHP